MSNLQAVFTSTPRVVHALLTYTDWWQPATGSIIEVGDARRNRSHGDGIRPGLLDTVDVRAELSRRMASLAERDRHVLFLWYVKQLPAHEIAREVGVSRRQCFRIRSRAIRELTDDAEDAA